MSSSSAGSEPAAVLPVGAVGWLVALWGVLGVCAIVLNPILRLSVTAVDAIEGGLGPGQWVVAGLWSLFMVYTEGYRGFHLRFSPRVVVRALALSASPRPLSVIFAPLMCMGLIDATPKRLKVSWALVGMITLLVVAVRQFPEPWRGIIDLGVVLGLSVGLGSIAWHLVQAISGSPPDVAADLGPRP